VQKEERNKKSFKFKLLNVQPTRPLSQWACPLQENQEKIVDKVTDILIKYLSDR